MLFCSEQCFSCAFIHLARNARRQTRHLSVSLFQTSNGVFLHPTVTLYPHAHRNNNHLSVELTHQQRVRTLLI